MRSNDCVPAGATAILPDVFRCRALRPKQLSCAAAMSMLLVLMPATPIQAQVRGAELSVGLHDFLSEPRERWPAVGGRLRLGSTESPVQIGITGTLAFDPIFGSAWSELGGSLLTEPASLGGRLQIGAGYSVIHVDMGAGSGVAHGAHAVAGLRLGANRRRYVSIEARGLIGPSRRRQDTFREPVRTFTAVLSLVWRR